MEGLGAGIASLAFWGFIAAVVVGGMWYALREREAQYATLRSLIESGQELDEDIDNQVLGSKQLDRDLRIAAYIVLATAPGVAVLAWCISLVSEPWLYPLLGVAALVAFVGLGLLVAAKVAGRAKSADDVSTTNRTLAL